MLKIAHRGNRYGKTVHENQVWYLQEAIAEGYDVEADIWLINNVLWLGHDGPSYKLSPEDLDSLMMNTWFHCKNLEALDYFINNYKDAKFFWHQNDNYALTSNGLIWAYPDMPVTENTIIVDFDGKSNSAVNCYGICSDMVGVMIIDK